MARIDEAMGTDIFHKNDFVIESDGGDITTESGLDNYKTAMLRRWMTSPGTLLHRPKYGAGLKDFQNAIPTMAIKQKIAKRIEDQSLRDTRTARVNSVRFETEDLTPDRYKIIVSLTPVGWEDIELEFQPFGA